MDSLFLLQFAFFNFFLLQKHGSKRAICMPLPVKNM